MTRNGVPITVSARRRRRRDCAPARRIVAEGTVEQFADAGATPTAGRDGTTSAAVGCPGQEGLRSDLLPLCTPAEAAQLLAVRESWLRRKAAARAIPCTFLGKHLRFSRADPAAILAAAAQPPRTGVRAARSRPGIR